MVAKDNKRVMGSKAPTGSPKVEVGEIDTRAPFQSVRDAVSLFGDQQLRKRDLTLQRVLAKETQLHMVLKELNKLKEQLHNAESTRAKEVVELERAKRTLAELSNKLKTVTKAKESAIKAMEAAKDKAKQLDKSNHGDAAETNGAWKQDLEATRKQYMASLNELDLAKQELQKMRQDCFGTTEKKTSALKQTVEAEDVAKANIVRADELSKEISTIQESIGKVRLATVQTQEDHAKIYAEKDVQNQLHKAKLAESAKKLLALKEDLDPELTEKLESQLAKVTTEIGALEKDMDNARTSDLDSVKSVTLELDDVKDFLQKVADEESSLKSSVDSLKQELERVKKEHAELQKKENETESIAGSLLVKLHKRKSELEGALAEESKVRGASEGLVAILNQLSAEIEDARQDSENMKKQAEELKLEAENTRIALKEAEETLEVALMKVEEAKAAESSALDQIKLTSERTNAARASTSESGAQITLSREEYESLSRKVEESDRLAEMKVAAALAQAEAVKASENEALKKLEATQKEIDEIKAATQESLKRAEMAEAAKMAVEGELRRWAEREQKKAAEAASRILAETEMTSASSPGHYRIQNQQPPKKSMESKKMEKPKTMVPKKVLITNLSGIFHRMKNQVEGASLSFLPGERST